MKEIQKKSKEGEDGQLKRKDELVRRRSDESEEKAHLVGSLVDFRAWEVL